MARGPNNSFKPNLLRYTKHMAEKARHVFGSTTQVGLTQALDRIKEYSAVEAIMAISVIVLTLVVIAKQPKPRPNSDLPDPSSEVQCLLEQGKKVAAIRAYRRQTGATLLEASNVVGHHAV